MSKLKDWFPSKGDPFGLNGLKEAWYGKPASLETKTVEDPYKIAVTTPLSKYLASEIGQGIPKYTEDVGAPIDEYTSSRYTDFMSLDPGAWFDKAVYNPAMKKYKEDAFPLITEGYAGSLRGSGRFGAEEAGIGKFSEDLATQRETAYLGITQAQLTAGMTKAKYESDQAQLKYKKWMSELPEYSPVVEQALAFVNGATGRDTIAWTDPGQEGWLKDLAKLAATAAAAAA